MFVVSENEPVIAFLVRCFLLLLLLIMIYDWAYDAQIKLNLFFFELLQIWMRLIVIMSYDWYKIIKEYSSVVCIEIMFLFFVIFLFVTFVVYAWSVIEQTIDEWIWDQVLVCFYFLCISRDKKIDIYYLIIYMLFMYHIQHQSLIWFDSDLYWYNMYYQCFYCYLNLPVKRESSKICSNSVIPCKEIPSDLLSRGINYIEGI